MKQKEMKVRITNSEQKKEKLIEQKINEQDKSRSGSGTPVQDQGMVTFSGSVGVNGLSWTYSGYATWEAIVRPIESNIPIHEGDPEYAIQFQGGTLNLGFTGGYNTSIDEHDHTVIEQGNNISIVQPLYGSGSGTENGSLTVESTYSNIPFVIIKSIVISPGETQVSSTTINCNVTVRIKISYNETTHELSSSSTDCSVSVTPIP